MRLSPAAILATWFGAGLLPRAPGTWGSLAALPFAWVLQDLGGNGLLLLASVIITGLGWLAANHLVDDLGVADPQCIVIDEVVGIWLTLAVVPRGWTAYALGFALFRAADIVKPWPARWADRSVGGGLGVMLDDILAAGYSAGALWLLYRLIGW